MRLILLFLREEPLRTSPAAFLFLLQTTKSNVDVTGPLCLPCARPGRKFVS